MPVTSSVALRVDRAHDDGAAREPGNHAVGRGSVRSGGNWLLRSMTAVSAPRTRLVALRYAARKSCDGSYVVKEIHPRVTPDVRVEDSDDKLD